ncbi:MAG: hypothetical protein JST86_11015 [Bacteroidetes bacterium]|nr:hypothetical protein [Bacteroidota bacterium]
MPVLYITTEGTENNCCGDSTAFSPQHTATIYTLIALCIVAYFYSSHKIKLAPPVIEVVINILLLTGIVLNIFIARQTNEPLLAVLGNVPVIMLFVLELVRNHGLYLLRAREQNWIPRNKIEALAWKILTLPPLQKYPLLVVVSIPVLLIIMLCLLLFGQKPDSFIRAFTETYRHGFSQWDYQCDNVQCGGHYLCSVAANGHKKMVRPQRLGIRNGHFIICNRQLLVSNAFEELVQERMPGLHRFIRKKYNKVGNMVHKHYHFFNIKLVSDIVYVLMKPLEWFFILVLYTFDNKPENRIAAQYLDAADRKNIAAESAKI